MKLYKMQHKPTGLFYVPSKGSGNFSKKGKIYAGRKPEISWTSVCRIKIYSWRVSPNEAHKRLLDFFKIEWNNGSVDKSVKTDPSDWEIVEIGLDGSPRIS